MMLAGQMMQNDTEPKFCKDCKHFSPSLSFYGFYQSEFCRHPKNMSEPDLVYGYRNQITPPKDLRKPDAICGPDGAMFEAKPPEPPPEPKREPGAYVMVTPPRKPGFWDFLGL